MKQSAGLAVWRQSNNAQIEVLLVHPGGPFWAKKDKGVWSIPKGELEDGEAGFDAAKREFTEETGVPAPGGEYVALSPVKQSSKIVHAWAVKADVDVRTIKSNAIEIEWPPKSGQLQSYPEVDKAAWFSLAMARTKILAGQAPLLDELEQLAGVESPATHEQTSLF